MIDTAAIGIVSSSISAAIDIAKGLTAVRDAAMTAQQTSALADKLLQAQEALLRHNAGMFELQAKYFEACEELRKISVAAADQQRYPLVNLGLGFFAHRVDPIPQPGGATLPGTAQEPYYLCQQCLENGRRSVLQVGPYRAFCSACKHSATIKHMATQPPPLPYNPRRWT
ncbi:MAG: hypothetical protein WBK26_17015 [Burkholderiaceae bacterium]